MLSDIRSPEKRSMGRGTKSSGVILISRRLNLKSKFLSLSLGSLKSPLILNADRAKLDCLLIVAAAVAPIVIHLPRLGFYSDDWPFLARMSLARDQSFVGLLRELLVLDNAVRPVQWVCITALYKLFGLHPLGYHIANTTLIALASVLFYLCLRQLREPHLFVLAVPLLYALLPHYSTDRLWIAALQANLSACLFFMSFYADGRAVLSIAAFWWWNALGVALVLLSGFAYEVFLPLVIMGSGLLAVRQLTRNLDPGHRRTALWRALVILGTNGFAVVLLLAIKALLASRGQREVTLLAYLGSLRQIMLQAFEISYADHVLNIPFTVWQIVNRYATVRELITGGILGVILVGYLNHVGKTTVTVTSMRPSRMLVYAGLGIVVFAAGFSLFPIRPTMNGINNRAANAASVGVALSLVGAIAWITRQLSADPTWWPRLFAAGIAAIGVSGFLTFTTVAAFWAKSYERQLDVLAGIKERFPTMTPGTSFMLDGVCPYHGPAIVFDTPWDLAGALMLMYGQPDLRADVLHSQVSAQEGGLIVASYGVDEAYPYDRLLVYHVGLRQAYAIRDAVVAQTYLADIRTTVVNECPPGRHGTGAQIPGMSLRSLVARLNNRSK
jgi:hypothetical protein